MIKRSVEIFRLNTYRSIYPQNRPELGFLRRLAEKMHPRGSYRVKPVILSNFLVWNSQGVGLVAHNLSWCGLGAHRASHRGCGRGRCSPSILLEVFGRRWFSFRWKRIRDARIGNGPNIAYYWFFLRWWWILRLAWDRVRFAISDFRLPKNIPFLRR